MKLPFLFKGIVIKGNQLGRTIGYPTANLLPEPGEVFPLNKGVYAVIARVDGTDYGGMGNVGVKPTVGQHALSIEINIFDFDREIYGKEMEVTFVEYIREEQKFPGLEALKNQIARDEETIRRILQKRM